MPDDNERPTGGAVLALAPPLANDKPKTIKEIAEAIGVLRLITGGAVAVGITVAAAIGLFSRFVDAKTYSAHVASESKTDAETDKRIDAHDRDLSGLRVYVENTHEQVIWLRNAKLAEMHRDPIPSPPAVVTPTPSPSPTRVP